MCKISYKESGFIGISYCNVVNYNLMDIVQIYAKRFLKNSSLLLNYVEGVSQSQKSCLHKRKKHKVKTSRSIK